MFAIIKEESINWTDIKIHSIFLFATFEEAKNYFEKVSGEQLTKYNNCNAKDSYYPSKWKNTNSSGDKERFVFVKNKLIYNTTEMPKQLHINDLFERR
jgi:hypothetical protein